MSSLGAEPDGYKAKRTLGDAFAIWYWNNGGLGVINLFILAMVIASIFLVVWLVS